MIRPKEFILISGFVLWNIFTCNGLTPNGHNVVTYYDYSQERYTTSCKFLGWGRCTRYRQKKNTKYRCKSGYRSTDDKTCPHAICGGQINPAACKNSYPNSHIIYSNGVKQTNSGGTCSTPNSCTGCNKGFYSSGPECLICTAISNCDLEECTNNRDSKCSRCNGVVQERAGYRAYVASSDKKQCIKACSWRSDSTYCYPGSCGQEYASQCTCTSGFTDKNCHHITTRPNLLYNLVRFSGQAGETVEAPANPNSHTGQGIYWTNIIRTSAILMELRAEFKISPPARPAYVEAFAVGMVSGGFRFTRIRGGRRVAQTESCGAALSEPETSLFSCSRTITNLFKGSLEHGDELDIQFMARNGGYVKVRNKESNSLVTYPLSGTDMVASQTMRFDTVKPYHCVTSTSCRDTMLKAQRVNTNGVYRISWDQWQDAKSGIQEYSIEFEELHAVGDLLRVKQLGPTTTVSASSRTSDLTLSKEGVYSVTLSARDKATNHRSARRKVIYDVSSVVEVVDSHAMKVTTAPSWPSQWQTVKDKVTVDWTSRFINKIHHNGKWLNTIAPVSGIDSDYDAEGGTSNVQGIVKFMYAFAVDKSGGSSIPEPPGSFNAANLAQSKTITPNLVDGNTVRFWVRAYDIKNDFKEESVAISIDTSEPVIQNLWLTKGQRVNISVHNLLELNEMTMEWLAYDEHSGLDTISWRVFNRRWSNVLVNGIQHISAQGDSSTMTECQNKYRTDTRDADCYCTPGVGCYHRHFQVKPQIVDSSLPHGGIFSDKNKGIHDKDYYLEVTATNHAGLIKTVEKKITIDSTAPHAGSVHDGRVGESEVDYTVSRRLQAHWDGFFDTESGVMFYRYYFGTRCLTLNDFELNGSDLNILETKATSAEWTHPGEGKYFVTVVAYNSAMDPSDPVCSDGVLVDYSQPSLSEVFVRNSRIIAGLARTGGSLWFIDSQRQRTQIINTGSTCAMSATDVPEYRINMFPLKRDGNGTVVQLDNTNCEYKTLSPLPDKYTVYLYKEHQLFLNWTGIDEQSGIYDYEVGLATDDFGVEAPDILPYTSTNHHSFYFGYHLPISEGKQFYIAFKAINKARNFRLQSFGPILVTTFPPVFSGGISVSLKKNHLVAEWPESAFSDQEKANLKYEVAVGTDRMKSVIHPFKEVKPNSLCPSTSPLTCAAVSLEDDLSWDLHHSHTYYVSVRATNVAGLSVIGVSSPYVHDVHMPLAGTVLDVIPSDEEKTLQINSYEDSDYQLSTTTLRARWYGFDSGIDSVTYEVGIGTEPSTFNIREAVSVGTNLEHEFTGLNLQEHRKYFVTVAASTSAGNVRATSDGISVLKADTVLEGVTLFDGPKCPTDKDGNPELNCPGDIFYQASTSIFEAHWTGDDVLYPIKAWALERKIPNTDDAWEMSRDYEYLGNYDSLKVTGVALEAGDSYRVKLKACVGHVCTKPVHSDGVTIIPHPPAPGSMSVRYEEDLPETGMSQVHVSMAKFRDPDIVAESEAFDVMDKYEWSLTDNSHSSKLLTKFVTISSEDIKTEGNMIKFTLRFPKHIDFSKCRRISVRGYNKVGHSSVVSADVKDCKAVDPAHVVPSIVIDAYGTSKGGDLGSRITMDQNDVWQKDDVEFTPYKNILSAVFPTLRHRNYTWAVVHNGQIEPTSHFKRANLMTVKDPCSILGVLKCGHTENEYVNVEFPPDSYLQHGDRYYICIHADEMNSEFEKWTAELAEVNACSNGVTIDLTPPEKGTVSVKGLLNDGFQVSNTEVEISWTGFDDIEEMRSTTHPSGIAYFEVSLGSLPGSDDVVKLVNVGYTHKNIFHSLSMENGHTYYATVKGTDFVGKTTQAVSKGFIVDTSAPMLTGRQIQTTDQYIKAKTVHVCWKDAFVDVESGMLQYDVGAGSRPGFDDVFRYTRTTEACYYITIPEWVKEGYTVFISVKGYNKVLMHTELTSRPLIVSTSAPSKGYVYDGLKADASATDKDQDIIVDKSKMGAYWEGFHHPHSPISMYRVKVGTCPGCDDTIQQFEYGSRTDIKFEHTAFSQGVKYYTTVTACTTVGFCTQAASDGVSIDTSPPIVGRVSDGTGDVDIQFQASRSFIGAKWHSFYDPESGLHHYDWRVGTTPGGEDVFGPIHAGLGEVVYRNLPSEKKLPVGQKLYSTIRVYNKAGLYSEKTSNGFVVDDTRPIVQTPPRLTPIGSLLPNTSVSRTTLSVEFMFKDEESFIERQYISISSHVLGEFQSRASQVPGFMKGGIVTGLNLHDGSRYEIKVTACNMAALCTSATTPSILVDSTRPETGAFAIETERAVRLGRHQAGWMTYTDTTVTLAWLGFSDLHSGIDHYLVAIGKQPFTSDHNENDAPVSVEHKMSGTDKGDEGIVQINTFNIKDLPVEGSITVTLWAVNKVGLKSRPYIRELFLYGSGRLTLMRECQAFSCEGQCVCMSPGKTCPPVRTCSQQTDSADNDLVTVKDIAVLRNPSSASDIAYSPMEDLLAASWEQTKNGITIHRYEYSAGECTADLPQGIFNTATDQVWFYAGKETSAVVTVPRGRKLASGVKYCFFVKAWYEGTFDGVPEFGTKFRIFKSNGVTIDARHPTVSEKLGTTLKELKTPTSSKDIDFQESKDTIYIDWKNRFLDSHTDVIRYNAFISTSPGGHGVKESNDLSGTSYTAPGLNLDLGTIYYSGVVAYNQADLMSWVYSDGVQLDLSPPTAGVVHDGTGLADAKYQQSPSVVSASWFGFSDADSAILKYVWCVGPTNDTEDCGIMAQKDVGLHVHFKAQLDSPLANGATVYSKVHAIDILGHRSAVSVSDGVTIDTTAPQPKSMAYLGENLIRNPSFETGTPTNSSDCHTLMPVAWESSNGSCIRHISSDSLLAKEGIKFVSVSGGIQQTVVNLVPGHQYKLTLHTGYPETVLNHHQPLEIIVEIADKSFVITLDPNLCKGTCEFGEMSIILWNKHSFRFTAQDSSVTIVISSFSRLMEFVLDHVSLESVDYVVGAASVDTEEHLNVHSFFLSHWSYVHTSWHFEDMESQVVNYKWAIGTVSGGTQIQNYTDVGRDSQGISTGYRFSHGTSIFISVMATNGAGLSTVTYSGPVTVDLTGPVFDHVYDGMVMDEDYQATTVVSVNWKVDDVESGIDYCAWAIGTVKGRSDVKPFEKVNAGETFANKDMKDELTSWPITLYTSVRCVNKAGLTSMMASDGVKVVLETNETAVPGFRILKERQSVFSVREQCHQRSDRVRMHWDPTSGQFVSVVVGIDGNQLVYQRDVPTSRHYTSASLSGFSLDNATVYEVSSFPLDVHRKEGMKVSANITTWGQPPSVSAGSGIILTRNGTDLVLSWRNVFSSSWIDLDFEVHIGTVLGGTDVAERISTKKEEINLALTDKHKDISELYVTVSAIDSCGLVAYYSQKISIA